MAMIPKSRRLMLRMHLLAEAAAVFILFVVGDLFRRRPRPCSAALVSGIAPDDGGNERPLSETQLRLFEAWLRLHREGWRRNIIPPANPSYFFIVEHSDATTTFVYLFSRASAIYFSKFNAKRFDAGWLHVPATEVDRLIALIKEEV